VTDHALFIGDGQPCDLCGTHSIPTAMIQLMFPKTEDQELFKEKFLANPCEIKDQFWEHFYETYNGSMPLSSTLHSSG